MDWLEKHFGAIFIVWALIALAIFAGVIFIIVHFVSKYW